MQKIQLFIAKSIYLAKREQVHVIVREVKKKLNSLRPLLIELTPKNDSDSDPSPPSVIIGLMHDKKLQVIIFDWTGLVFSKFK